MGEGGPELHRGPGPGAQPGCWPAGSRAVGQGQGAVRGAQAARDLQQTVCLPPGTTFLASTSPC